MRARTLAAVALATVLMAGFLSWYRDGGIFEDRSPPANPVSTSEDVQTTVRHESPTARGLGIPGRPVVAANALADENARDETRLGALRSLASAPDITDVHALDSIPMRLALLDPVRNYAAERSCRDRFAKWSSGQRCFFRIRLVVEDTDPGPKGQAEGIVTYTRGELLEDRPAPPPGCEDLMRCIAATKLGLSTPAPGRATAVSLELSLPSNLDETCDPEALRSQIEVLEADLEAAEDFVPDDASDPAFHHLFQERIVEYLRLRLRDCG